jgi:hypothetical protein
LGDVEKLSPSAAILDLAARIILVLETLLMATITAAYVAYALLDEESGRFLWGAAVVCALFTVGIAWVAWGFNKGKRFALGAAFAWQLMQVSAGVWLLGSNPAVGAALLATAAIVAFAVMRRVARLPREPEQDAPLEG